MKTRLTRIAREWAPTALFIACMFTFRSAAADWYQIPSESMLPTLQVGDRVLVDNTAYNLRVPFTDIHLVERSVPLRGEVITFRSPVDGERLIKRVVVVAGDRIAAFDGKLVINGEVQPGNGGHRDFGPYVVPADHVFVMGDNRDNSFDSRYWGPLPLANVRGHAIKIVASIDGLLPRTDRVWTDIASHAP
ncbi:signal peptidase I [Derxia gummosa]|uniref:Signal peptidase I n=1 Tax=Derxia gummosa DSM 723 TaxID=1121388 RepID=A0A8B6XA10_9BURK|nr:signal peptidase I [Derxia gummosa]